MFSEYYQNFFSIARKTKTGTTIKLFPHLVGVNPGSRGLVDCNDIVDKKIKNRTKALSNVSRIQCNRVYVELHYLLLQPNMVSVHRKSSVKTIVRGFT